MGRKSALTDKQWEEIGKRLFAGEGARALGREFGVSDAAIRQRFSSQHKQIKTVANQMVNAEAALKALPITSQIEVCNYADTLRSLQVNMLTGAGHSASNFARLSMLANEQTEKLDGSKSLEDNAEALKTILAYTKGANDAAVVPMALLNANKDAVKESKPSVPSGLTHFYGDE